MAGLEERLSKLESILHRLFCCDTNQFVGPQGPQGPQGDSGTPGLQGPTGAQGAVGPAGLNWQGEWTPCVVYSEDDAVGWNGASYYVTCPASDSTPCNSYEAFGIGFFEWIDCEGVEESITLDGTFTYTFCSITTFPATIGTLTFDPVPNPGGISCGSTACVPPNLNPCFALLASQGAVGPQGPAGIAGVGVNGNDGSNSGRWKFLTTTNIVGAPGSTYFVADTLNFNTLGKIVVSNGDINSTSYQDWWIFLEGIYTDYQPLVLVQITEVGSNNIIGIWELDSKYTSPIVLYPTYVDVYLDPVYVGSGVLTPNKNYTISWSIHGGVNGSNAPKTEGIVTPVLQPGPYPTLQYDYNELNIQPVVTPGTFYHAILPVPTFIGQTLVVRALGTNLEYDRSPGIISHDGSSIINLNLTLTNSFTLFNQSCMRFTWSGNYWTAEDIQGFQIMFNDYLPVSSLYNIIETVIDSSTTFPTQAYLNATYPETISPRGVKVYCPSIPGGPRVFTKITNQNISSPPEWASYPYTVVT